MENTSAEVLGSSADKRSVLANRLVGTYALVSAVTHDAANSPLCDWKHNVIHETGSRLRNVSQRRYVIRTTCLKFFCHIARADLSVDHSRALRSSVAPLPRDWNRRSGRLRQTWLQTVESDAAPLNNGSGSGNCLSSSTKLTGMDDACVNVNIHYQTSHVMMYKISGRKSA